MKSRVPSRSAGGVAGLLVFVLLAVGVGGWAFWKSVQEPEAAAIDPDRVVVVERGELLDAVTASGRVEPLARVAVMSRASGILEKLLVEEGDEVRVGQVLAELDREQLQAQLAQDRADLASADARLSAARARLEEARVKLDDPELPFVRAEAERMAELFASGDVSQNEHDAAQRQLASVEFGIAQVRASLPVLEASVQEAQANRDAAAADLERSETAEREATIRCPIDGLVLVRDKEVGDGVSSILTAGGNATQIMTLGDVSTMFIDARVDEVDLGRVYVGQEARITVDAYRGRTMVGRVQRVAPAGSVDDNGIVTFEVRLTVEDPDGLLKPDMTADAKLVLDLREDVPILPQRAVGTTESGFEVKVVVPGENGPRIESRPVELGLSDGLRTQIVSGVEPGERVLLPDGLAARRGP